MEAMRSYAAEPLKPALSKPERLSLHATVAGKWKTKDFWTLFWLGIAGGILGSVVLEYALKSKCPNCGKPIYENIRKCPHCKILLEWRMRESKGN